jgi:uncharacterized protein YbaP (TraB family)
MDLDQLAPMQTWYARQAINRAYRAHAGDLAAQPTIEYADAVLTEMARAANKVIHSEFENSEALFRFYSNMPEAAQREDLVHLLDYIDDEEAGRHENESGWLFGRPNLMNIEDQRRRYPALYNVMHVERNRGWAQRIDVLLHTPRTYFACLGLQHVLGPDGIPQCLARQGIRAELI